MLGGEGGGHHVGILVGGRGLIQGAQPGGERGGQVSVHVLGGPRLRVGLQVLQQVARVLGEYVDRSGRQLGHVDLALADPQLAFDRESGALERLGVDLGQDLVRVVVLRPHHDRGRVPAPSLQRVGRAAGG